VFDNIRFLGFFRGIISQQIDLIKHVYTSPTTLSVLKSHMTYHVSILLLDKISGIQLIV